ncbi:caspase-7-like [Sabethes cyaneus]|uniref:caspase-7-like n=1 Tax=Sabethes cyaneus TaxID=53552 RepID=UPI00237E0A27|nr:caspase-7-like [Sabethes cyaneus]
MDKRVNSITSSTTQASTSKSTKSQRTEISKFGTRSSSTSHSTQTSSSTRSAHSASSVTSEKNSFFKNESAPTTSGLGVTRSTTTFPAPTEYKPAYKALEIDKSQNTKTARPSSELSKPYQSVYNTYRYATEKSKNEEAIKNILSTYLEPRSSRNNTPVGKSSTTKTVWPPPSSSIVTGSNGQSGTSLEQQSYSLFNKPSNLSNSIPYPPSNGYTNGLVRTPSAIGSDAKMQSNSMISQRNAPIRAPSISSTASSSSTEAKYDLSNGKAYVLILHHKKFKEKRDERHGSEKDLKRLKEVFKDYRVSTLDICSDFTIKQVQSKMIEISRKDFKKCCCLLVFIMSHGGRGETIKAYDGNSYNLETDIVDRVLNNNTLKDKPKLFFIQACKGNALMETDCVPSATNKNDIMKCYSTYEGTMATRDPERGTIFIQSLFDLIENNKDKNLRQIMPLLRDQFKKERVQQVPTDTSTLSKEFYFADLLSK